MVNQQRRPTDSTGSTFTMMPPPTPLMEKDRDRPRQATAVLMRERGRQSCAECRRLKLKCSREWPCTSCEKRGCAQICPNGEMKAGKGKRLILADTEELHQRIQALELALAQTQALTSPDPHPLLTDEYSFSPSRIDRNSPYPRPVPSSDTIEEVVDSAFGTLTIGTEGQARFVGSFAGSEYLREAGGGVEDEGEASTNAEQGDNSTRSESRNRRNEASLAVAGEGGMFTPPSSANNPNGSFPAIQPRPTRRSAISPYASGGLALADSFMAGGVGAIYDIEGLRRELPDWETEGRELCESYWENVNWMYQILPRPMFDSDHLMNAYDTESPANAHKLACVFFIMAIGVMFDLNRQPFDKRGEKLFLLGRACLSSVGLEHASPATVQALHLCGTYMMNDKHGNGAEMFWPILGTAVKVAQGLGLHRDGEAFGLSEYEVVERRQVWWELVMYDRLQAICFGRPCATSNRTSDTKFPQDGPLSADGDGYHGAKYRLMEMYERVIEIQTQTAPVPFSVIAKLDNELRQFKEALPETLMPNVPISDLPMDATIHPHLVIHRLGIRLLVAQTRLLLNRPLFTRAMKDNPEDPSRSKVGGTSFLGLYESAQEIVSLVKNLVVYHPSLIARWWFFWFHAFTSAVCLSAIAIRAPFSPFASPAFAGMSAVCDISAAARPGCRAKKGLPILVRLRKRAHEALIAASQAAKSNPMPDPSSSSFRRDQKSGNKKKSIGPASNGPTVGVVHEEKEDDEEGEDDLSHLTGSAKLRRVGSAPSPGQALSGPGSEGSPPGATGDSPPGSGKPNNRHPTHAGITPLNPLQTSPSEPVNYPQSFGAALHGQHNSRSYNDNVPQTAASFQYATPSHSRQTSGGTNYSYVGQGDNSDSNGMYAQHPISSQIVGSVSGNRIPNTHGNGNGNEMSPSDNMSVSTSVTLREPTMFDGIVPPPPPLEMSSFAPAPGAISNVEYGQYPAYHAVNQYPQQYQHQQPLQVHISGQQADVHHTRPGGSRSISKKSPGHATGDAQQPQPQPQASNNVKGTPSTSPGSFGPSPWVGSDNSPWSDGSAPGIWAGGSGNGGMKQSPSRSIVNTEGGENAQSHHLVNGGWQSIQPGDKATTDPTMGYVGARYATYQQSASMGYTGPNGEMAQNGPGMRSDLGLASPGSGEMDMRGQGMGMGTGMGMDSGMGMGMDFGMGGMDMDMSMALGLGGGGGGAGGDGYEGGRSGFNAGGGGGGAGQYGGPGTVGGDWDGDDMGLSGDAWAGFDFESFVDSIGMGGGGSGSGAGY